MNIKDLLIKIGNKCLDWRKCNFIRRNFIGNNCAGSLITKNIPDNCIVDPFKILRNIQFKKYRIK